MLLKGITATFVVGLISSLCLAVDVEIVLEAELANVIEPQMVVAVPADAVAMGGPEPDEPSNGQFVWQPGTPVTGGGWSGHVEFQIDITQQDTYAIWGRCISWDGNSDSFWVLWQPVDPDINPQITPDPQYRWTTTIAERWSWCRVNGQGLSREWELEEGPTVLSIWVREDATMLDCLYITNDIRGDGGNARVPTDEERMIQIHGPNAEAVNSADKLSITWGGLKLRY